MATSMLLLPVFCLYHLCDAGTVIPRCAPGQLTGQCNNTEAPVPASPTPEVKQSKCPLSMENYCLNGDCVYIPHENIHYCRCTKGYSGARCMHFELVQQPMSKQDVALTVALTFLAAVGLLIVSYLIYMRFRKNRSKHQSQNTRETDPIKTEPKELFLGQDSSPPNGTFHNLLHC
ncbi:proepiregulin-like [Stegostoma tigrinum]|uniref:proepiregulin-like n=1 Tax=Stegostoma tigrinum TaxID=3053191 RepID=UPI00202B7AA2|nr:proepiregulin-like [Stegostoma tigrinum]